jgi:hypothetical protein
MHQTTAPYTSAQNGKSEHLHRTIMGRARAMRSDAGLPPNLWAECALAAFYLAQRTPTRALQGMTPYEAFYGKKPRISHLREYGCRAFVLIQNKANPKIYVRSEECVLVGYSTNSKAYRCWNRKTKCIITSYNVTFIESQDATQRPPPTNLLTEEMDEENGSDSMVDTDIESEAEGTTVDVRPLAECNGTGAAQPQNQNPGVEGETPPVLAPAPALLRRSNQESRVSAAGAAMRGLTHTSRLDRAREEVRASTMRTRTHRGTVLDPVEELNCF